MSDEPRRMLTVAQVLEIVPVRRTTLFKMERRGAFPASHYASPNRRFWFADEVAAWQQTLPVNSRILRQPRSGSAGSADKPVQGRSDY